MIRSKIAVAAKCHFECLLLQCGLTPLHWACWRGQMACVQLLLRGRSLGGLLEVHVPDALDRDRLDRRPAAGCQRGVHADPRVGGAGILGRLQEAVIEQ